MDQNEEDVITACGAYLVLQEEEDRQKREYCVHQLWRASDDILVLRMIRINSSSIFV
jgi:hypothetical protein